jgi:hypothetical protein
MENFEKTEKISKSINAEKFMIFENHIQKLCGIFFTIVGKCCSEYLQLFYGTYNVGNDQENQNKNDNDYNNSNEDKDNKENNSTLVSLLLSWIKIEINNFIISYIDKIKDVISDVTLIIINQLRKTTIGIIQISPVFGSRSGSLSGSDLSGSGLTGSRSIKIMKSTSTIFDKGPLHHTSIYMNTAFLSLNDIDKLGLNGHVTFAWLLLSYIKQIISEYCDNFHKETILEVRQDNWIFFEINNLSISKSVKSSEYFNHNNSNTSDNDNFLASSSYAWMTAMLGMHTHMCI